MHYLQLYEAWRWETHNFDERRAALDQQERQLRQDMTAYVFKVLQERFKVAKTLVFSDLDPNYLDEAQFMAYSQREEGSLRVTTIDLSPAHEKYSAFFTLEGTDERGRETGLSSTEIDSDSWENLLAYLESEDITEAMIDAYHARQEGTEMGFYNQQRAE